VTRTEQSATPSCAQKCLLGNGGKRPDAGAAGKKQISKVTGFNGLKAEIHFQAKKFQELFRFEKTCHLP
jgi:hypothetical protein